VSLSIKPVSPSIRLCAALALACLSAAAGNAAAQTLEVRQWQGTNAVTRQPEQVVAVTTAEWRSLWSRVGIEPPIPLDIGRVQAVGIFLGGRSSDGYAVDILSATRRRDRIIVVFAEHAPDNVMTAQAAPTRSVASPPAAASFAPIGTTASLPPIPFRPPGPPTSPWAILLLSRADLPITVEQRLFLH